MKIVNASPIVIGFLCRVTIQLTDEEHWDDRIAMISCITAPLLIQFAFGISSVEIVDGVELWHIAIVGGTVSSAVTAHYIRRKYALAMDDYDILLLALIVDAE